jgi:diadenosine tetraphosphate (Ap4A) HIT family hydrolase
MTACPFCHLREPQITGTAHAFAIADKNPISSGHSLIIPRRHVVSIFDLQDDEYTECFRLARSLKALLKMRHHPVGFNLAVNDGRAAGQTVRHAHIHIVPRYRNDRLQPAPFQEFLPGPRPDR